MFLFVGASRAPASEILGPSNFKLKGLITDIRICRPCHGVEMSISIIFFNVYASKPLKFLWACWAPSQVDLGARPSKWAPRAPGYVHPWPWAYPWCADRSSRTVCRLPLHQAGRRSGPTWIVWRNAVSEAPERPGLASLFVGQHCVQLSSFWVV